MFPSIFLKQELNFACGLKYQVQVILVCGQALITRSMSLKVKYTVFGI